MPPQLALVAVSVFVAAALLADSRRRPQASVALWVPLVWVAVLASRPLSQWFDPGSSGLGAGAEDGNPVDRLVLSALMAVALLTLLKRRVRWTQWISANPWLVIFILYCGLSVVWSDYPLIAIKRWFRALGSILMILVVLSDEHPVEALGALVRRCTYILVPFSILFIKYYRHLGVAYDEWTGEAIIVGVTMDKNALGRLCLVAGLFGLWEFMRARRAPAASYSRLNRAITIVILAATVWLLRLADSATSIVTVAVGSCILVSLGMAPIRRRANYLGLMTVVTIAVAAILGFSFGLAENAASGLGRNMTLTTRTFVWSDLVSMGTNPIIGVGYDSFWLGERLSRFIRVHQVTSAHNGYLEVYLELGFIGLVLFAGVLLAMFRKGKQSLSLHFDHGRLRVAMIAAFVLYNMTESGYKATTFIFFVLLLVAIDVPVAAQASEKVVNEKVAVVSGWAGRRKPTANSLEARVNTARMWGVRPAQRPRQPVTRETRRPER